MSDSKLIKTKICTCCSNDSKNCYCHPSTKAVREPLRNYFEEPNLKLPINVSLSSEKHKVVKQWLKIKEDAKMQSQSLLLSHQKNYEEVLAKQRHTLLELERMNFKIWLVSKRKAEMEAKRKQEEFEQQQEIERRRRRIECQISFQQWLQMKEQLTAERRRQQQMRVMTELKLREKQIVENQNAFNQWLEETKDRSKSISSQGLRVFRSKSAVSSYK